jgi:hypothetical protein
VNCDGLIQRLGYECRSVGEDAISVTTPFLFADGEPICFYLEERKNSIDITDNADTLTHLAGIGWDISKKRTWTSIRNAVSEFGLQLLNSGEIVGNCVKEEQQTIITSYIGALLSVVDLEKEFLGLSEEQSQYIAEVEMYLRRWKPNATFNLLPTLKGHSGRPHSFHFEFDGSLVEAARPHGTRTGAILRKALDIRNVGDKHKVLVVMDDREDPDRAKAETDILTTVASVMSFSRLVEQAGGTWTKQ